MNCKDQAFIASHCLIGVEEILKKCGLENMIVDVKGKDGTKEYIAVDEIKKAIKILYNADEEK